MSVNFNFEDILTFWFEELEPAQWWKKDSQLDNIVRQRFTAAHQAATRCELSFWRQSDSGRLAEIIVLDQFSRNIYRDLPLAFAWDSQALTLAQEAIACGTDDALPAAQRSFLYLPYMHSESPTIHEQAVQLYQALGNEDNYQFELRHKAIIDRFGRYPHRNAVLGRDSTDEELAFLEQPGSSF